MSWDYLSAFWDQITGAVASTTENLISYPVSFFQNIGNAVAGAIGQIFDTLFHTFSDIFVFGAWTGEMVGAIFSKLTLPFQFVYNFFKNIYSYGFATPSDPDITYTFSTSTMAVFETIPYWSTLIMILGIALVLVVGLGIFKLITKI